MDLSTRELVKVQMMRNAYLRITEQMGPSEQLLAFVNFDGQFGSEIGLESFDALSLETRHEILKSKLEDTLGMEGLLDKIKKVFSGKAKLEDKENPPLKSKEGAKVKPYGWFSVYTTQFDLGLAYDTYVAEHMPQNLNVKDWEKYHQAVRSEKLSELHTALNKIKVPSDSHAVPIAQSGWNDSNVAAADRWLTDARKRYLKFDEILGNRFTFIKGHFNKIDSVQWENMSEDDKKISKYFRGVMEAPFGNCYADFNGAADLFNVVGKYFSKD